MSLCEPCNNESWVVNAGGYCEEPSHHANYWICLHPNAQRVDHKFHGERCRCHCNRLFCRSHARAHARAVGQSVIDCFPNIARATTGPALGGALAMRGGQSFDDETQAVICDRMTRFLAGVAIGWEALDAALAPVGGGSLYLTQDVGREGPRSITWMDEPESRGVRLAPRFFTPERLDRTAVLALHVLTESGRFSDVQAVLVPDERAGRQAAALLRAFGVYGSLSEVAADWPGEPRRMSEPTLYTIAALSSLGYAPSLHADAIARALPSVRETLNAAAGLAPRTMDDRALAAWLVSGEHEADGALVGMTMTTR